MEIDIEKYIVNFNDMQKDYLRRNIEALNEDSLKTLEEILEKNSAIEVSNLLDEEEKELYKDEKVLENFNYMDAVLSDLYYKQPMFSGDFFEMLGIPKGALDEDD